MKRFLFICLLAFSHEAMATAVSFATFNIKFYGNDSEDDPPAYIQDRAIREFMNSSGAMADVIAFQEIVDISRLKRHILGRDYRCATYWHPDEGHIHVVLCHRRHLRFVRASDDNDYELEDVALNSSRLRPGVHGVLQNRHGHPLAHIVALHLKANPDHSSTRFRQLNQVARYLTEERTNRLPVVVLGDVNTHGGDLTRDESYLFRSASGCAAPLCEFSLHLAHAEPGRKFDRVWVSRNVDVLDYPQVVGPCNAPVDRIEDVVAYNEMISDHCPVKFRLNL